MSWEVGGDRCENCVFQIVGAEPLQAVKVEFCPLHKAAPELLKIVKSELESLRRRRTMDHGDPPGYEELKALVKKAEGQS